MSDKTKWTPGPWKLCGSEHGGCPCNTVGSPHHPIAEVTIGPWGDSYPEVRLVGEGIGKRAEAYLERIDYGEVYQEQGKANAYLISAAPDLYAAVTGLLDRHYCDGCKVCVQARAALAKAGE